MSPCATESVAQAGVTIAELLVAVAILGLLCGFVITRIDAAAGGLTAGTGLTNVTIA